MNLSGVKSYSSFHLWQLKSDTNVASISLQVDDKANEQVVRQTAKQIFKKFGILQVSIQIEKREFEVQLNSIYPGYRPPVQIDRASFLPKENHSHSHSHSNDSNHGHSHSPASNHGHSHSPTSNHGHSHDHSNHGHSHDEPKQTAIGMNGSLNPGHF